jgi:hypothetical protein
MYAAPSPGARSPAPSAAAAQMRSCVPHQRIGCLGCPRHNSPGRIYSAHHYGSVRTARKADGAQNFGSCHRPVHIVVSSFLLLATSISTTSPC